MTINSTRPRLLGLLVLAIIFLTGGVAGTVVDRTLLTPGGASIAAGEDADANAAAGECEDDDEDHDRKSPIEYITLTPDQRQRVDGILDRRNERIEAFWDSAGPRIGEIADSARGEIREVLTPRQRMVYDSVREARRRAREAKWGDKDKEEDGGDERS